MQDQYDAVRIPPVGQSLHADLTAGAVGPANHALSLAVHGDFLRRPDHGVIDQLRGGAGGQEAGERIGEQGRPQELPSELPRGTGMDVGVGHALMIARLTLSQT